MTTQQQQQQPTPAPIIEGDRCWCGEDHDIYENPWNPGYGGGMCMECIMEECDDIEDWTDIENDAAIPAAVHRDWWQECYKNYKDEQDARMARPLFTEDDITSFRNACAIMKQE